MEKEKPDLSGQVNGFALSIFRRGRGFEITVDDVAGQEVALFRYSPTGISTEVEKSPLPAPSSAPALSPETSNTPQPDAKTPIKVVGIVESVEGMGETPNTHEPIFRFAVRWTNPKTSLEEVRQVATFKEIAQGLHRFHTTNDAAVKLQPGRPITFMAWDHPESASLYPSSVSYLTFPPLTNPKKRR